MSLLEEPILDPIPSSTSNDDFLIKEIVLTHDPDDHRLDSEMLLSLVENTFCLTSDNVFDPAFDASSIDLSESSEEPVSRIINTVSKEIHCQCFENGNLHRKTLELLEILGHYRWDAKVVLALASFAHRFALFSLVMQLQSDNQLAVLLAVVRQLPKSGIMLTPKFKAMNLLLKTMLKLTKIIISFEGISLQHELVDDQAMDIVKSSIYIATYWIVRSVLVCSSQIVDFRNLSLEQVCSDRTVVAAWGLHSLGNKLNSLCHDLGQYVENCQEQIEKRLHEKLLHMFKEKQADNEKALHTLFASQREFPFKNPYSRDQIDILELKNKVVLLLITKPDLLPLDKIFFLAQQTQTEECCAIIWVPISSTKEWSLADKTSFEFFSNRLPWLSVRRPWLLNSSVIRHIRQEWGFEQDPIMVVLDENGLVTNKNAMDMVWVWGAKGFPFSISREKELWKEANWTIDLTIDGISPLFSEWVKDGNNLCLYGSDNLEWIKEFNETIKKIMTNAGIHLELFYVGWKNPSENVKNIITTMDQENLSTSLTFNSVQLFWFRLEAVQRSACEHNHAIAAKVAELLEPNGRDGWAVIGRGSSMEVTKLDQEKLRECITAAFEPPVGSGKCQHDEVVPYEEGLIEKPLICGSCRRHIDKFVLYKCEE